MSSTRNRVTVPCKIIDNLYNDEEFFREVTSLKKVSLSRFPKNDQWVSEEGFHMVFALAGYGPEDLSVQVCGSRVTISSSNQLPPVEEERKPKQVVSHGVVNRGIARRNFKVSYFISEEFESNLISARMNKGLLTLIIPHKSNQEVKNISILNK
tara:strand:+ start:162 stop:623 length:462 start_codon:yes stop_codon:yes gene_type:complete